MLLGGAPLDGERHIWWNFVSSSRDPIEEAKGNTSTSTHPPVLRQVASDSREAATDFVPVSRIGERYRGI
jgi:hypothetical protein